MRRFPRVWLPLLALGVLAAGCGSTYATRKVAFTTPTPPRPEETLIYVFREDSFVGSARDLVIIDNDTVVAVLTPRTFSHFTVPTGEHEIVGYMSRPIMHYRVMPSHGRIVYLLCKIGYASGLFMEPIDEGTARPLMSQFEYREIEVKGVRAKADYKAYYDKLFK